MSLNTIFHIDSEKSYGGGQRQLVFLMEFLKKHSIKQYLVTPQDSQIGSIASSLGIDVLICPIKSDIDLRSSKILSQSIEKHQPQLIHAHTSRALACTFWYQKLFKVPLSAPILHTRRVAFPIKGISSKLKYRQGCDHHIAISHACLQQLQEIGISNSQLHLIHSGVNIPEEVNFDKTREHLCETYGLPKDSILVGSCGNLLKVKRFDLQIEALQKVLHQHPETHLILFGEGSQRESLELQAQKLSIHENVHLVGHTENPEQFYAGLDLFISTSEAEGLGSSLIDAMARGVSLLAPKHSGIVDIIRPGENGFFFESDMLSSLTYEWTQLLKQPTLLKSLGTQGRQDAMEKFDIEQQSQKLLELYQSLL